MAKWKTEDSEVRDLLRNVAGHVRKMVGDDAEDVAQEAVARAVARSADLKNPKAYAMRSAKNIANNLRRDTREYAVEDVGHGEKASSIDLDRIEEMLELDGAMEGLIVWGGTGSTKRAVHSVADVDIAAIQSELEFYLAVLDELPRCDRQRRRLRAQFQERLTQVVSRSVGYQHSSGEMQRQVSSVMRDSESGLSFDLLNRGGMLATRFVQDIRDEEIESTVRRAASRFAKRP